MVESANSEIGSAISDFSGRVCGVMDVTFNRVPENMTSPEWASLYAIMGAIHQVIAGAVVIPANPAMLADTPLTE